MQGRGGDDGGNLVQLRLLFDSDVLPLHMATLHGENTSPLQETDEASMSANDSLLLRLWRGRLRRWLTTKPLEEGAQTLRESFRQHQWSCVDCRVSVVLYLSRVCIWYDE